MTQPTLEDARALSGWRPPLGVLSVYLGFDPADRGGAWRTELRNGVEGVLDLHAEAEHEQRIALRATAKRLLERFEDGDLRPPPLGEAGFVEVGEKAGVEHWFGTGTAPAAGGCVEFGSEPVVAPLLDLCGRGGPRGVALLSAERVRLLRYADGNLDELEDRELTVTSLDWRERKAQGSNDPARAHGVSSSGHDQFDERLDHNRQRFLAECGSEIAHRLEKDGLRELVVFGPAKDLEGFRSGFGSSALTLSVGDDADLISVPTGKLGEPVCEAVEKLDDERRNATVARALGSTDGSRGATGLQETREALAEGRVDHLVFDVAIGSEAESLIRAALSGGARVTVVRGEAAAPLAEAEGVAAVLRY